VRLSPVNNSMIKKKAIVIIVISLLCFFVNINNTKATIILYDDFDIYSTGNLTGQGGWYGTNTLNVNTTQSNTSPNSINNANSSSWNVSSKNIATTTAVTSYYSLDFYIDSTALNSQFGIILDGSINSTFYLEIGDNAGSNFVNNISSNYASSTTGLTENAWHHLSVTVNHTANTYTFSVDGVVNPYTQTTTGTNDIINKTIITRYGGTSDKIYLDNIYYSNDQELEVYDYSTHIVDMYPHEGDCYGYACPNSTSTQELVDFAIQAYIAEEDVGSYFSVKIKLTNIDQNSLLSTSNDIEFLTDSFFQSGFTVEEAGLFTFATSTYITAGNYRVQGSLERSYLGGFLENPFSSVNEEISHNFIVDAGTFIGTISQTSFQAINGIYASTTATSTSALAGTCSPVANSPGTLYINTQFSVTSCLTFLFVPDAGYLNTTLSNFKSNVATHFPVGYLTDFISIMSTTTATLPTFEATVPNGIPGTGSTLTLDATNALDFILEADVGQYTSPSASSTVTFYEYTIFYWEYIVDFLAPKKNLATSIKASNGNITSKNMCQA